MARRAPAAASAAPAFSLLELSNALVEAKEPPLTFEIDQETAAQFLARMTMVAAGSDYWTNRRAKLLYRIIARQSPDLLESIHELGLDFQRDDTHRITLEKRFTSHFDTATRINRLGLSLLTNPTKFTSAELKHPSLALRYLARMRAAYIEGTAAYVLFQARLPDPHRWVKAMRLSKMEPPAAPTPQRRWCR